MQTENDSDAMVWSDTFVLGFGPMHEVHEEFVDLVGAMQKARDEEPVALLEAFAKHAQARFNAENPGMVEMDFPARECHIDEYAAVMRSVHQARERLAGGDYTVAGRLADELASWFPGHVDYLDSALAHWICKRRLGGKPVILQRDIKPASLRDGASLAVTSV